MKRLEILLGSCWAEAKGYKARELLIDVGARPTYVARRKAWNTTPRYARDAVALAERRGYDVMISSAGDAA